ncbi:MAG: hypothetical protein RLZZ450_2503 [Pseudomonadota bacterium]|jgi:hypothetical protein
MLETRHKSQGDDATTLPGLGTYAFNLSPDGVHLWNQEAKAKTKTSDAEEQCRAVNWEEPIQAYHPVFFNGPQILNYGHLTDIHINSRVNLLQRSPAQVVTRVGEIMGTKKIADLVEPTNRAFRRLLSEIAGDAEAHALLVGGDLIDHQLNAFSKTPPDRTMKAVWDAVSLENQKEGYVRGADMVAFYTMLVDFCRSSSKPAFGVSGNHDCYLAPFGISPRMLSVRANAGIPADLNLTLYEAILAFGPTFDDFKIPSRAGHAPSSFDEAWMEWFYTVFTPFTDFRVQLAKQQLVCLGWGNDEHMVAGDDQGVAHLPRADESVSAVQLKLVTDATRDHVERPVTLLTHFTVASYREEVPMLTQGRATVGRLDSTTNKHTMGTFEKNRAAFIQVLTERTIECVLTGHSHRRGLYFLNAQTQHLQGAASATAVGIAMHEPKGFAIDSVPKAERRPAIIVSDSAGPYPRYNRSGEFEGWGSDKPGGSVVKFDERGELSSVKVVQHGGQQRPRLAVALDYFDIDIDPVWAEGGIETAPFTMDEEADMRRGKLRDDGSFYRLRLALSKRLPSTLRVASLTLHGVGRPSPLTLSFSGRQDEYKLLGEDNVKFWTWCQQVADPDRFLSVTFVWEDPRAPQYEVEGSWDYEARLLALARGSAKWYSIERPRRFAGAVTYRDLPDFAWRTKTRTG